MINLPPQCDQQNIFIRLPAVEADSKFWYYFIVVRMGDEIRATIVEKPSYRMAERTMHLQTYELDHKGDILLIVDCSLLRSKKVNCTHHRETGKTGEGPIAADLSIA